MVKYFSTTNTASTASSLFSCPARHLGVWAEPSSGLSARRLLLRPAERRASRQVGHNDPSSGPSARHLLVRPYLNKWEYRNAKLITDWRSRRSSGAVFRYTSFRWDGSMLQIWDTTTRKPHRSKRTVWTHITDIRDMAKVHDATRRQRLYTVIYSISYQVHIRCLAGILLPHACSGAGRHGFPIPLASIFPIVHRIYSKSVTYFSSFSGPYSVKSALLRKSFKKSLNLFSVKFTYTRSLVPLFCVKGYRSLYRVRVSFR